MYNAIGRDASLPCTPWHGGQLDPNSRTICDSQRMGWTMKRQAAKHIFIAVAAGLVVLRFVPPALAQDVPGIEICTRESRLDRRTGCLQSNVEFLQQVVARNALDAQQKLAAASRDIMAMKEQLAGANRDIAALKEALAAMQARIEQLQKAGPPAKPEVKPEGK